MPEPLTDRREIDARLQQRQGSRMPKAVWMEALGLQRLDACRCGRNVLTKQISHTEARELSAITVDEERVTRGTSVARARSGEIRVQALHSRRPQRAGANLIALAVQ